MRKHFIALFALSWKFLLFWISAELFILFLGLKFSERWVEDSFHLTGVFAIPICLILSLSDKIGDSDRPFVAFLYILFVVALALLFFFLGLFVVAFSSWSGASLGST